MTTLRQFLVLCFLLLQLPCGARTGLRVPVEPAVTFTRVVASTGARHREIFEVSPFARTPDGRVRVGGVAVRSQAVHTSGDWIAYSTAEGLFVQDSRGYRTRLSTARDITTIDWAADAQRIAFVRAEQIWVVNARGGAPVPLTPELSDPAGVRAASPSWSPDAGRVYFLAYRQELDDGGHPITVEPEIRSVTADGSDPRLEHGGPLASPGFSIAVSRNGAAVLYTSWSLRPSIPSIVRIDLATGATSPLVHNAHQPALSASGLRLAFIRAGQVWVCDYDGSTCARERRVSNGTDDSNPSWVGG